MLKKRLKVKSSFKQRNYKNDNINLVPVSDHSGFSSSTKPAVFDEEIIAFLNFWV
ncbi:unnamed protein product [Acanthoscelides obtectus]|uniref:Uncharacterized protein n=1 Tax=Acanthoscelides obtectus TaxID=200917 RepID=A0A9P0KFD1_ACAOB|nr:unnamed protein product [Acanthoscelides obtectus]CAK1669286.1 hypothetical protein AOBTE_LOCUS26927 [Acanthoscelides obtectus]